MNPLHTPKRLKSNQTEWLCENCGWVSGHLINVTGYAELACEHCDKTLEPDYYGLAEAENEAEGQATM